LLDNHRILVAAPSYLERNEGLATIDDLARHECLVLTVNRDGEHWRLHGTQEERSIRPSGRLRTNNGDAIRQLAMDGQGIAFLSSVMVADPIRSGQLVQVLPQWKGRDSGVYAVCPPPAPFRPAVHALVEFLLGRWRDNMGL
jgi:DNA-binding transcriptional LysR family regulator